MGVCLNLTHAFLHLHQLPTCALLERVKGIEPSS
jgi:hypothetical protein